MADKITSGAWHAGGPPHAPSAGDARDDARRAQAEKLRARRDNARWSAVVGFAMLFGASFASAFLFGGVAMILYGATASVFWSVRLRKVEGDPWAYDPDLDGPHAPEWARTGKPPHTDDAEDDDARPPTP